MNKTNQPSGKAISLAAILRKAAKDSDLSVYRIAKDSGVDQSTLNKFLNGERENLRLDVADRLFRFFSTSGRFGQVEFSLKNLSFLNCRTSNPGI